MLSTVEMSRLTMAGSKGDLDEALRLCANLRNVHISPYSGDEEGITVGVPHPDADDVSTMLAKVRAASTALKCVNKEGPISAKDVKNAIDGKFPGKVEKITEIIAKKADSMADISRLEERASILTTISPLDIPLELMTEVMCGMIFVNVMFG